MVSGNGKKVLVGLSGGIDSAVSAYLLIQQGYQVEAAFMKNWSSTKGLKYDECPWLQDRQDALRVAAFLRIPLHTLDFEKEYEQNVLNYFFKEYEAGRTPNPDVMCNKEIKFKLMYGWAMENGFDFVATGHYAQVEQDDRGYHLMRSEDDFKDQTYFIHYIKTEQLPHILFPVGSMKKDAVRSLAREINLPNAEKKESMGLCFVGKIRLKEFLSQKVKLVPGPIIDQVGKIIGQHEGLPNYTIGQRQGIKVGATGPYYVVRKNLEKNILEVTNDAHDPKLSIKEITIADVNWIEARNQFPYRLQARYRHQGDLVNAIVDKVSDDRYRIIFDEPQEALASGQSLVMYQDRVCIGGGVIE